MGDPPLIVEHQDNVELEAQLAEVKTSLKQQKEEVAKMAVELDRKGRELASRKGVLISAIPNIDLCRARTYHPTDDTNRATTRVNHQSAKVNSVLAGGK